MSRKIMFRAKDKFGKNWVYGYLTIMWGLMHIQDFNDENTAYEIDPNTLGQYTNFDADDGREICDGDYVKITSSSPAFCQFGHDKDCEGVVDFLESGFVVTDRKTFARPLFTEDNHVEIIGNIYDNPELLEK